MKQVNLRHAIAGAAITLLLVGCAGSTDSPVPSSPPAAQEAEPVDADAAKAEAQRVLDETSDALESAAEAAESGASGDISQLTFPAGLTAHSSDFPFPVPDSWTLLEQFAPEVVGKKATWSASFEYPGDAQDAAQSYRDLLESAGIPTQTDLLGEQVNAAAFFITTSVNEQAYSGHFSFDTIHDGTQRAVVGFVEQN